MAVAVVDHDELPFWDLYELGIACAVFGTPQPTISDRWYDLRLCAERPDPYGRPAADGPAAGRPAPDGPAPDGPAPGRPGSGFSLRAPHGWEELAEADTVLVAALPEEIVEGVREVPPALVAQLRRAADAGARMVSLCTGAFALAAAGLLDGRRATAHWAHTAELARRHPAVTVDDSVLYVDDGDVLTSAGAAAGLDLCLHIVRRDLGANVANRLARRLVVPAHRPGGQAQFVDLSVPVTDDDSLAPVLEWATAHLEEPLTVDDLARRARMSPRTFFRRLQAATGTTPLQWLLDQRVARAQTLLEATDLPVEQIGERSGLGSATNLRRHFTARVGVTPTDYRRSFAAAAGRTP
ncbi:GlxA family transcriptional regulator [Kitasatospora sp. NPDC054939]